MLELTGSISSDSFDGQKWVDDKWVGSLKINDSMVFGRWYEQSSDWKFIVDAEDILKADFITGQEIELIDAYWGERVELVIDKSIQWKESVYSATDGDDHDHCLICWATISENENRRHLKADERVTVCLKCFEIYVRQNNLNFITYPKRS